MDVVVSGIEAEGLAGRVGPGRGTGAFVVGIDAEEPELGKRCSLRRRLRPHSTLTVTRPG